ncbi:MAG: VanZ family protein [Eubacterium ramulus]
MFTNLLGNVIGFIPYGFILPVITHGNAAADFSDYSIRLLHQPSVETVQLITKVGCFDVDDLILNTLGAALGYLLFCYLQLSEEKMLWQEDIDMRS